MNVRSINRKMFLVRIDKEAQRKRREMFNDWLIANPNNVFLTRNMQHGEIVEIGSSPYPAPMRYDENGLELGPDHSAREWLPKAQVGDTLLFHHIVEGTMDDRGGNDPRQAYERNKHILFEDETYRYYWLNCQQAYAVDKGDGNIITTPDWILCEKNEEKAQEKVADEDRRLVETKGGILVFSEFKETESEKQQKLDRLQKETQYLSRTNVESDEQKAREVREALTTTMAEMKGITRDMTKMRALPFIFLHGSEQFNRDCGHPIDRSYLIFYNSMASQAPTLEYKDREFVLIKVSQILYVKKIA